MHKGVEGSWTWGSDGVDGETPAAIEGTLRAGLLKNRSKKKKSAAPAGNVEKASVGELEEELIVGVLEELSVIKAGPNDMDTRVIDIDAMRREASEAEQALAAALLAQGIRTDHSIQACQAVFAKSAAQVTCCARCPFPAAHCCCDESVGVTSTSCSQDMSAQALFREALDWLCLNLPAEALPASFRREGNSQGMTLVKNTPNFTSEQAPLQFPLHLCVAAISHSALCSSPNRVSWSSQSSGTSSWRGPVLCKA